MRWLSLIFVLLPIATLADDCVDCHAEIVEDWQSSDHYQAMLPATEENVLGEFNTTTDFHGVETQLIENETGYSIKEGKGAELAIKYTFGHRPLQQYLIETTRGHLQASNIAWDSEQREWFHLRDEPTIGTPFYWQRHLQNWNGRCADCHSTGVSKNYDAVTDTYETSFAEVNVSCAACHGNADEHVADHRDGDISGKSTLVMASTMPWGYEGNASIASPKGEASYQYLNMCGGCHSRRTMIAEVAPGESYHDQYEIALLDAPLYHPDGQINDEVFVLGSFMQSKMYQKGVTCMNCHNPHSGQVMIEGNGLCAQCHNPTTYDVTEHKLHPSGTAGSMCVDCHMPEKTYMQVDDRRDHRFGIPDPMLSEVIGVPNACQGCHQDKTNLQLAANIDQPGRDDYALALHRLQSHDPMALPDAVKLIIDPEIPAIKRATLLTRLPLTQESMRVATTMLQDDDPMVRMAAVRKINEAPVEIRRQILPVIGGDPAFLVRREVGRGLAEFLSSMPLEMARQQVKVVNEYRASLSPSLDLPSGQTSLAKLEQNLGNRRNAEMAFERALRIEPDYIPAMLNLADLYRAKNDEEKAMTLLESAVAAAPDSGAANHALGLALVRQQKTLQSLNYFKAALQQVDRQPRYAYVYAVALDSVGQTPEAVRVLADASVEWPFQFELLMLEVTYREKAKMIDGIEIPLKSLRQLAPNMPEVTTRLELYGLN